VAKSIYPPKADSNGNSGILPPPFGRTENAQRFGSASMPARLRRQSPSVAIFAFGVLLRKTPKDLFRPASMPADQMTTPCGLSLCNTVLRRGKMEPHFLCCPPCFSVFLRGFS
jgi:hypothetical protein